MIGYCRATALVGQYRTFHGQEMKATRLMLDRIHGMDTDDLE